MTWEYPPSSNSIHKLADILKDNVVYDARLSTTSDRTFDCHPKLEEPDEDKG